MRSNDWNKLLAALLAAPIPIVAHAETYLSEEQAAAVLFPGVAMQPCWIDLSPQEVKAIDKASGQKPLSSRARLWRGPNGETLLIDRVLGKHEFITYAVAITGDGKVKGIEIMDYRETFGTQIRQADWRQQFVGKSLQNPPYLDKDIKNISGATLSSKHVTDGVRRALVTYDILKSKA